MKSLAPLAALVAAMTLSVADAAFAFEAGGSARQVYVTDAEPGTTTELIDPQGKKLRKGKINELGAELFRGVKPGEGYRVKVGSEQSDALTVLSEDPTPPSTDVYDQTLVEDGYGYMTMRDGTKLAYSVHPPTDVSGALGAPLPEPLPAGPKPVLVEYAGYGYARPSGPESGISLIANIMGFTVVDVNMRGTGCSGGAFDFFEPLQSLDGYDIVETVARQPWTANGKVGLLGISYGGISQLFTASTQPPSLAAITPVSLLDQVATTLYPGGILNTGFAFNWSKERAEEARPAGPKAGQEWAYQRIQEGDEECKANQALHAEAPDLLGKVRRNNTYKPKVADPLSPITFVDRINVPTFMACQNTDEQTGGHCPTLASRLSGTDKKWITFTNGPHIDSLAPGTLNRLYDFLMLYVAKQPPMTNAALLQATAPVIYEEAMGISGLSLPPDPVQQRADLRGCTCGVRGAAVRADRLRQRRGPRARAAVSRLLPGLRPVPAARSEGTHLVLRRQGRAERGQDEEGGSGRLHLERLGTADGQLRRKGDSNPGGLWTDHPNYQWLQDPAGTAVAYVMTRSSEDTTVIGQGSVTAWVKANKPDVDLQATICEVRPDGKESFVQGGWLRTNMRTLDKARSRRGSPRCSAWARDVKQLPRGRFTKVTIPLYFQSHAYREGSKSASASRRRTAISRCGRSRRPSATEEEGEGRGSATARACRQASCCRSSRASTSDELPPCPGLRGQPCRDYVAFKNKAVKR